VVSLVSTLTSGKLTLNAGDSIVISFEPTNLEQFYSYGTPDAGNLTDVLQWGSVH